MASRLSKRRAWISTFWVMLVMCVLILLLLPIKANAQDPVIWSKARNLSLTPTTSRHPAIVADDYGNVHVFWTEALNEDTSNAAIMYTRWNGNRWIVPTEILVSPDDAYANFVNVDVGLDGRLHAVWGGLTNFYYSSANSWEAENPNAWRRPMTVATNNARSARESDIAVDKDGIIHIAYATKGQLAGVYHIASADGGTDWSEATNFANTLSQAEYGYSNVRIVDDSTGRLHATWDTFQEDGFGQAVYYARSLDQGATWEPPIQFEFRDGEDNFVALPYLTPRGEDELHLIYVDGNDKRRAYRKSLDGGETWSEPEAILTQLEGVNSYVFPLVDGNDRLHVIANMRTQAGQQVGIYHIYNLVQGGWSSVTPVDNSSPGAELAHATAGVVRLGNEIHIVYNQFVENEIWYVRGEIQDVEQEEALPIPVSEPSVGESVQEPIESAPAIDDVQESPSFNADIMTRQPPSSQWIPILFGAGIALLLVLLIVVVRVRRI